MEATFYAPRFKDGKILALADVEIADGVIVKGFRVVNGDKGLFAAVPSKSVQVQGETRYFNQVAFTGPEIKERFLAALLEAYARWEQEKKEG